MLALFATTLVASAAAGASVSASGVAPQLSEAESEAATQAGVEGVLGAFVPPPGATPLAPEPTRDSPVLPRPRSVENPVMQVYRWWTVPGSFAQALDYVEEHPVAGATLHEDSSSGSTAGIGARWPAVAGARGPLGLEVNLAELTPTSTEIQVVVTGEWLVPRAASEAIASGMRLLRVSVSSALRAFPAKQRPLTITNRGRIERVAGALNALPILQRNPLVPPCPLVRSLVVRFAFYRDPHRRPVAVARDDFRGCGGVELELNEHLEPELEGPSESQIDEALGVRLDLRRVHVRAGAG